MALEIIGNIVSAEKEADRIKLEALDKADAIKAAAAEKGKEILAAARKEALGEDVRQQSLAKDKARPEALAILSAAKEKAGLIREKAQKNKKNAVDAVVRRVVEGYGNR